MNILRRILPTSAFFAVAIIQASARQPVESILPHPLPKADGYRGIWYFNQPSNDQYVYKYSGGLGTYCAKHIPLAYYAREVNKTFFGYGGGDDNRSLHPMVSYYDHATGMVPRPAILLDKKTSDAHDNSTIMLDGQKYIWVFISSHGTARPAYIVRSRKPCSIDAFELIQTTNFSYPQAWYLEGHGFLFLHTKYINGRRVLHWMTSADGVRWTERRELAGIAEGHYQVSGRWRNKVGAAFNYHPAKKGLNWRTNLYYLETDDFGETWRNVRGEMISVPLRSVMDRALVHNFENDGRLVYLKDISYDAQGHPIILFLTSGGYRSGPENGPRIWMTARWTGEKWDVQGSIQSDSNYDMGSLYVEADGTWRIIAPTEPGPQPFNPGGEVALWISRNQGESWIKERQLTQDSEFNHTYVRRPVNAHPDFYAFWADGHARRPSESRLYFANKSGTRVFRLPERMTRDLERPIPLRTRERAEMHLLPDTSLSARSVSRRLFLDHIPAGPQE